MPLRALEPKSSASANSATFAHRHYNPRTNGARAWSFYISCQFGWDRMVARALAHESAINESPCHSSRKFPGARNGRRVFPPSLMPPDSSQYRRNDPLSIAHRDQLIAAPCSTWSSFKVFNP